jgi:metallo-beta-lactamase family protein
MRAGRLPAMPVYVDSPMALAALDVYRAAIAAGGADVKPQPAGDGDPFDPGDLRAARTPQESLAINAVRGPGVIVSASGMAVGGRVLHHLRHRLPDARNTLVLPGFQAEGTRGRALLDGATELKMLGRYVPVRAEVVSVPAFSVHADQSELVDWLGSAPRPPDMVYVVHGEPQASAALRGAIAARLGWPAVVPSVLETVRLD